MPSRQQTGRSWPTTLISLEALPVYALLDALRAAMAGWRPVGRIESGVLILAAVALIGIGIAFLLPKVREAVARHRRELVLLCASIAAAWLLAEAGMAAMSDRVQVRALFHTRGPNIAKTFEPAPGVMPGIDSVGRYTTDVMGIRIPGAPRGDEPYQVLCIGGSSTECVYLDDAKTWPALLMQRLNEVSGAQRVWVGNVGFSGFATLDHLKLLRESPMVRGFECVILQPGINDLYPALAGEIVELHVHISEREDRPMPLWARSHLIQFYHDLRRRVPLGPGVEGRNGLEYEERRAKRRAARIRDEAPALDAAIEGYRERLRAIIEACRARDLDVVFTTQPVLWSDSMSARAKALCWFGWLEDGSYLSFTALRAAMERYNDALTEVCRETDTPCVDLGTLSGREALFYDDCHFNEVGAHEVAGALAAWFMTHRNGT
ncbi:MAG TPA: SGNH/GDSL hydrolase family protein [Candidatus Hydrogenedentes bacterium]|nr:SGNH/GDSL hydrolase family protein [Candidatus Hydrogenedentota bacterium]